MELSFNTSDPKIPPNRWIASLSDGTTVFENILPGERTAWIRLLSYLKEKALKITRLRYQTFDNKMFQTPPLEDVDGYFLKDRVLSYLGVSEIFFRGIGYIKDNKIHITWINTGNGTATNEVRNLDTADQSVFLK